MANINVEDLFVIHPGHGLRFNWSTLAGFFGPRGVNAAQDEAAHQKGLRILYRCNVLPSRQTPVNCPGCGVVMRTWSDVQGVGWRFACQPCHRKISPTTNTFLQNVRLHGVGADTLVAFLWMEESSQVRVREDFGLATDTVVAWYAYFHDVAYKVMWHDLGTIGGPTDVVEVDENHLFKRKYNVGRILMWRDVWLFGGISRTTRKVFGTVVPNRKRNTLLPIMDRTVDHESYMCSDEFRPYFILPTHFNGAGRLNHSIQFIRPPRDLDPFWYPAGRFNPECLDLQLVGPHPDPVPLGFPAGTVLVPFRIHTQNIENTWKWLKSTMAKSIELELAEKYVDEWMYRKNILETIPHKSARFQHLLNDLSRAYPGIGKVGMSDNLMDCACHECV